MLMVAKVTGLLIFNNVTIKDESISMIRIIKIFLRLKRVEFFALRCHLIIHWDPP